MPKFKFTWSEAHTDASFGYTSTMRSSMRWPNAVSTHEVHDTAGHDPAAPATVSSNAMILISDAICAKKSHVAVKVAL